MSSPGSAPRCRSPTWRDRLPAAYRELEATQERLERHFRDMQDLEFTVERGPLYPAADAKRQTHRSGRRCASRATWWTRG